MANGPDAMTYDRIYCDVDGESHFDVVTIPLSSTNYAPPAPPIDVSGPEDAARFVFFHLPAAWVGDFHPTPRRQLFFGLQGELETTVSDGETRRFGAGSVCLLEDDRGNGHRTEVVGDTPFYGAFVHLE